MPEQADFTLIAHRGASYDAPENTFEAFDLALSLGFDNFETDVQLTGDGRAVLIHDATLDRTTDATVDDRTLSGPRSNIGTGPTP